MNRDSTLVSYLHRLLILLTGSFDRPGHPLPADHAGRHRERHVGQAEPGRRRPHRRRPGPVQRHRRRDPDRPPEALPGDDRRGRQPGPLAGRLGPHARGPGRARHRRRHRRRDERDRAPRRLRPARRDPVREGGGDVLQLRVPRQRLPPAAPAHGAAARSACPRPRSTPAWSRRWARSPRPTWRRCARRPPAGARPTRRRSWRACCRTRARRPMRRCCCTGPCRCPTSCARARSCSAWPCAPR